MTRPSGRKPVGALLILLIVLLWTGLFAGFSDSVGTLHWTFQLLYYLLAGLAWLAVIIVLNAALAAFYYLRVVVYMYMRDPESEPAPLDSSPFGSVALAISVAAVVLLGLFPGAALELLEVAAASLL